MIIHQINYFLNMCALLKRDDYFGMEGVLFSICLHKYIYALHKSLELSCFDVNVNPNCAITGLKWSKRDLGYCEHPEMPLSRGTSTGVLCFRFDSNVSY